MDLSNSQCLLYYKHKERERQTERDRDRERQTDRDRERTMAEVNSDDLLCTVFASAFESLSPTRREPRWPYYVFLRSYRTL